MPAVASDLSLYFEMLHPNLVGHDILNVSTQIFNCDEFGFLID